MARILVIEDEPVIAMVLQEVLQDEGHEVELAGDGYEGLACLEAGPAPDLVVMDWFLPRLEGRDLLAKVSVTHPATPVVVITGAVPGAALMPPEGSYRVLLRKPFGVEQVLAAVHCCLRESGQARGADQ